MSTTKWLLFGLTVIHFKNHSYEEHFKPMHLIYLLLFWLLIHRITDSVDKSPRQLGGCGTAPSPTCFGANLPTICGSNLLLPTIFESPHPTYCQSHLPPFFGPTSHVLPYPPLPLVAKYTSICSKIL